MLTLIACKTDSNSNEFNDKVKLFEELSAKKTGVQFQNIITENNEHNYYTYEYFYNGGGVAVGDINNDGLEDIYFTGNQVPDKLYINKGDFKFEDFSEQAGIDEFGGWHTGVSMIDINYDGWLDIYVCRSGWGSAKEKANLLFINQNGKRFTEEAAKFGLADTSNSTQALFFDYDRNGYLDAYILNHPIQHSLEVQEFGDKLLNRNLISKDKFYISNGKAFVDFTKQAGIDSHGFGLGISAADLNNDNWIDIYVCNDFLEADKLYINQQNGKFENKANEYLNHISNAAMGVDLADFNNDGLTDIGVLDMAFVGHERSKRNMERMDPDFFAEKIKTGRHYQYNHNTLQLNLGNNYFSEIAWLTGFAKSDWSWANLFADFNNDGWKDVFITNGYRRDVLDNDSRKSILKMLASNNAVSFKEAFNNIPTTLIENKLLLNNKNLKFKDVSNTSGFEKPINSNGCAYADFDNDGDLDLVINHIDSVSVIYKNNSENNFLKVKLIPKRSTIIGSKVKIISNNQIQQQTIMPVRGYQSSVSQIVHFGLGAAPQIDSLIVTWPDGQLSVLNNLEVNKTIEIERSLTQKIEPILKKTLFKPSEIDLTRVQHTENNFNDYEKEILLPWAQSEQGPIISTADVNNDGTDDFYMPGPMGTIGQLVISLNGSPAGKIITTPFKQAKSAEEVSSVFFDVDNDNDADLLVITGGNEMQGLTNLLKDYLYLNDGKGNFTLSTDFPQYQTAGKAVLVHDFNEDDWQDVIVAGATKPGAYPDGSNTIYLQNNNGKLSIKATDAFKKLGAINDLALIDFNNDNKKDIVAVSEWNEIHLLKNNGGNFSVEENTSFQNEKGIWFSINVADLDNDGDDDFVCGNLGLNSKFKASKENPLSLYFKDFDESGSKDIVLATNKNGKILPVRGLECSSEQMPFLKEKFTTYKSFAQSELSEIYELSNIDNENLKQAFTLESKVFINENGSFKSIPLPVEAQFSNVQDILIKDFNEDDIPDLVTVGNLHNVEVETTRFDASSIFYFQGNGDGSFKPVYPMQSGLYLKGQARSINSFKLKTGETQYLISRNNQPPQLFKWQNSN